MSSKALFFYELKGIFSAYSSNLTKVNMEKKNEVACLAITCNVRLFFNSSGSDFSYGIKQLVEMAKVQTSSVSN